MSVRPYVIAPFETGLQDNMRPWLLPEDAFQTLEDAYIWRGRVRKRWGTSLLGSTQLDARLRVNLGTTDGGGNISGTVAGSVFKIGQAFSVGTEIFTVNATGTPAATLSTGSGTATYNTVTGAYIITGAAAATAAFFYPAEPVMGLRQREAQEVNFEGTIGFDTQFAYTRSGGAWTRLGTASWTGDDANFYWSTNYRGGNPYDTNFYVVNYVSADNIKYIPEGSTTWTNLRPQLDSGATRFLETSRILLPFKDRLVALNTMETDGGIQTFKNRARWCQNGDPTAAATAWLDDTPGRGGYIDAPVQEAIITAEFVKDRLIVYFERTTWELVYTGDSTLPFRWQQINSELGCESTFSVIGFDKQALGVGNVGIHACDGVNVQRIDQKIPDLVFDIHNGNDGPARVYGVRDYYQEMVYWTFPDATNNPTYPTRVLTYNYRNNTWAIFNDSFTCFGYLQNDSDISWADLGELYGTWANWNVPWGSSQYQSAFPSVVAGNQEGFTFYVQPDKSANALSLQITDLAIADETVTFTVVDHNLKPGDYVRVLTANGVTGLDNNIYPVSSVTSSSVFVIDVMDITGSYVGGGTLTRISNINLTTKQFAPGTPVGEQFKFAYIDFQFNRTTDGEVAMNYFTGTSNSPVQADAVALSALPGSNVLVTRPNALVPSQANAQAIWQRKFLYANSAFIQLQLFMTDAQMRNYDIATSAFELQGMVIYAEPSGRLIG